MLVTLEHRRFEAAEGGHGGSRALPWARAAVIGGFVVALILVALA